MHFTPLQKLPASLLFTAFPHFSPHFPAHREPQKSPNGGKWRRGATTKVETETEEKENFVITLKLVNCRTDIPLLLLQLFRFSAACENHFYDCTNYTNLMGFILL